MSLLKYKKIYFLKEAYHQFCKETKELPIFFQDWYLDAVCQDGDWEVIMVEKAGKIAGVLPYYIKQKGPFKYITMPPLNKMMGPFILPEFRTDSHFIKISTALIEQLPSVATYEQLLDYSIDNWLPFYWKGYQQTTRYSYVLDLSNMDRVYKNLSTDYKNNKIKKAKELVTIEHDRSLEALYRVNKMSFDRQQVAISYDLAFLKRLDIALEEHEARMLFFAIDKLEQIHAVAYLIWDKERAYYLLAGDDPKLRKSGAGILLAWRTIQYTNDVLGLPIFDFQGSMMPSIERVRRQFGAIRQPYFFINKVNSRWFDRLGRLKRAWKR